VSHPDLAPASSFIRSVINFHALIAGRMQKIDQFQTCNVQTESVAANIAPIAKNYHKLVSRKLN
jgi:hypothetical protein